MGCTQSSTIHSTTPHTSTPLHKSTASISPQKDGTNNTNNPTSPTNLTVVQSSNKHLSPKPYNSHQEVDQQSTVSTTNINFQQPTSTMSTPTTQSSIHTKIAEWFRHVPLLAKLNDNDRIKLSLQVIEKTFTEGQVIFKQQEEGYGFYIVVSGEVQVIKDGVNLAVLHAGDYFGEQALISRVPRAATVQALTASVRCFYLDRNTFTTMFGTEKLNIQFVKRTAVSGESSATTQSKAQQQTFATAPANAVRTKSAEVTKLLLNAMSHNVLFMNIDTDHKQLILNEMYQTTIKSGVNAIVQGELGDNLYIVESGAFDVIVNDKKVASRGPGSCFGELALMYNAARAATVTATVDSTVWVIDRFTFRRIVTDMSQRRYQTYINFLKKVELLSPLAEYERRKIAEAIEEVTVNADQVIFKQNQQADALYIVHTGEVKISKVELNEQNQKVDSDVMRLTTGQVFGERALHTNEVRAATATAVVNTTLFKLDKAAFTLLLGPLEDILKQKVVEYKDQDVKRKSTRNLSQQISSAAPSFNAATLSPTAITPQVKRPSYDAPPRDKLKVIGVLGKGSFGFVQLVQDPNTHMTFALKAVNKAQIVATGQQHHVMSEKRVMMLFDHPSLIKLYATYKDQQRLFFLLQPVLGGELFTVLRERTLFDEPTAQFYAAQIVMAFEYMHNTHNIVYRDLKPENLLLDKDGYLKITDFGFAKSVPDGQRTWTLCGTPDYLAPEIVSGKGHGRAVDWWCLGIFIYEMLASFPPFFNEDPMKTYAKIMEGNIHYPSHFSADAVSLISKLLQPRVSKRLGMLAGGAQDIKSHPWFKRVNFDAISNRTVKAPIIPRIKNELDTSNFDITYAGDSQKILPYIDDGSRWDADF